MKCCPPPFKKATMKREIVKKIYDEVFNCKIDEEGANKWLKAVVVNFGDERGDIVVKNDNFGTRRKYTDFTNGKREAGLHPMQIVFAGVDIEKVTGGKYINANDEVCSF